MVITASHLVRQVRARRPQDLSASPARVRTARVPDAVAIGSAQAVGSATTAPSAMHTEGSSDAPPTFEEVMAKWFHLLNDCTGGGTFESGFSKLGDGQLLFLQNRWDA
ncbi:hypothetical protein RvY_12224 [Ramazzottius varieornatus]|uniref:Uncharacterized protein n=1 Tax=Ramazzottius varieornatus TaxID=947166 RepID=A0A1D1VIQ7_RAMVA|nr:hypothetical protein RvY_12224 [Ramazzottius varieornatus]